MKLIKNSTFIGNDIIIVIKQTEKSQLTNTFPHKNKKSTLQNHTHISTNLYIKEVEREADRSIDILSGCDTVGVGERIGVNSGNGVKNVRRKGEITREEIESANQRLCFFNSSD